MNNDTSAKKKLVAYLKKQHPDVEDNDIPLLLNSVKRFVSVIHKIYTEPQAKISIKEVTEDGKRVKKRFIDTNIEELLKVKRNTDEPITGKTFRELTEQVTGVKYKRHGE